MGANPLHRRLRGLAVLLCLTALPLPVFGQGQETCFPTLMTGTFAEVSPHGDILLADGQRLRVADITLPEQEPWRQQALAFLKSLKNQPVTVDRGAKPDRWNRFRAAIALPDGDLAELMLAQGLAVVDAGEAQELCNTSLPGMEREARKRRVGLWSDEINRPVGAREAEKLLERQGRFTLVSGRIVSVGVRARWTYLNFGRDWKKALSVSISTPVWAKLIAKGHNAETLRGKMVLVRGIIRERNGPVMEITVPENLEVF